MRGGAAAAALMLLTGCSSASGGDGRTSAPASSTGSASATSPSTSASASFDFAVETITVDLEGDGQVLAFSDLDRLRELDGPLTWPTTDATALAGVGAPPLLLQTGSLRGVDIDLAFYPEHAGWSATSTHLSVVHGDDELVDAATTSLESAGWTADGDVLAPPDRLTDAPTASTVDVDLLVADERGSLEATGPTFAEQAELGELRECLGEAPVAVTFAVGWQAEGSSAVAVSTTIASGDLVTRRCELSDDGEVTSAEVRGAEAATQREHADAHLRLVQETDLGAAT